MSSRQTIASLVVATTAILVSLNACDVPDEVEIEQIRRAAPVASFARAGATSQERFGGGQMHGQDHAETAASRFLFETPPGWVQLAPQQFRDINFRPGGHPELDCYLTILQGNGGGLTANVNRWRGQLELDPITDAAAAALPVATLFGRPATRVELSGNGEDARALVGVIFMSSTSMATVKLTGPAALVEQQRPGFDLFCRTLVLRADERAGADASAAPARTERRPSNLAFDLPAGWTDAGASSMRIVNLQAPGPSQCYVIRLVGEAGGLAANLNRWRGEVGLDPLDQAEIEALPSVSFLGRPCGLLDVSGEYRGMGGLSGPGKRLLGVVLIGTDSSLFVKMVGPEADVAAERERFIEFVGSLDDA